ncbi:glycine betaine ABC transporter substrate-binding protein [Paenibacillus sp. PL91]|uniref:ABC transporter substrate-binding protein n=1 Tax=Paenibacillus sp. PL91 TaxID=2729538 RepID=UPI00145EB501|nr:glycine betaine ABC transporter substrate-binding protein [Paenibacillus sp. PL91]MBC9201594.1 glycine/betaine ABC transporter substrate-binding protein [Paenibacillus sp. PL91]
MKRALIGMMILVLAVLSACSFSSEKPADSVELADANQPANIVVGGKPFTEQLILVEIMAQLLDAKTDHHISTKEGLGISHVLLQALKDDDIQVYADYTGTGYIHILQNELQPDDTPATVYEKVKKGYEEKYGLTWLKPMPFSNTFTLIIKKETAEKLKVKTFSDLVQHSRNMVLGTDDQFFKRGDGYKGMAEIYGFEFKGRKEMDNGIAYQALQDGQIDVLVGYATDGRIPGLNLITLEDDKQYFPPYFPAPILKQDFLAKYPEVGETLNLLADRLDQVTMAGLNAKVDNDKMKPKDVAKQFLESSGLLK